MKLLFILPEYPPHFGGGISTFYQHLLPALVASGHQVDVLVGNPFTSQSPSYTTQGINVQFLESAIVDTYLQKFMVYHAMPEVQRHFAVAWALWEQSHGGSGYDLVETTDWGMLFAPWITSPESPPTVVQLHASIGQIDFYDPQIDIQLQGNLIRLLEVSLLSVADELQANSTANAQVWQQLTGRDVAYIPPALSLAPPLTLSNRSESGLVVGRIQYWKGPTVLCEALRLLDCKAPTIAWIGRDTAYQGSGTSMATHLAKTYPDIWGNHIQILGQKSPQETLQLQANAKFMVVPSIWDVFNYTCAEGMAQAKVVLCSQGAGAVDLITNGVNGLTFVEGNPKSLAESLDTLLSLSEIEQWQIGQAAQQTIQTTLAPDQIAQQRIAAYEKLLQRGKHPVRPNPWLVAAVSPLQSLEKPLAFLDRLPLKELSAYVMKRGFQKVMK
jgi:glycosyltransferase involved in cell wall biosynthesis